MKQILLDFYKYHFSGTLGCIIVCASAIGGMLFGGIYDNEKLSLIAVAVTVFLTAMLIIQCFGVYVIAPKKFSDQVDRLSDEQADELLSEYPTAKTISHHHYMSTMVLFYCKKRIYLISYKDINGVSFKGRDLLMHLHGKERPLLMPCPIDGLCAVAAAFMRDKNPEIKKLASADSQDTLSGNLGNRY